MDLNWESWLYVNALHSISSMVLIVVNCNWVINVHKHYTKGWMISFLKIKIFLYPNLFSLKHQSSTLNRNFLVFFFSSLSILVFKKKFSFRIPIQPKSLDKLQKWFFWWFWYFSLNLLLESVIITSICCSTFSLRY